MEFSFKVEGLDHLHRALPEVAREVEKQVGIGLFAAAKKIEAEAKTSIAQGKKTGRIYKRGTVTHQASAPGEAPASDTGRLINSITSYLQKDALTAFIVAGRGVVKYARMLEFGTSKIDARPFMIPAAEKSRAWIQERLNKAVRTAAINASRKK